MSEVIQIQQQKKQAWKQVMSLPQWMVKKISSFAEMRAKIATSGAGKEIELTYLRDGKTDNVKVTLQADDGSQQQVKRNFQH